MKTTATNKIFQFVQAKTTLPPNYRHQGSFDLSKSRKAVVGAIVSGIVLFFTVGWLSVQFINLVRPPALEALRSNIQTTTSNVATSFTIPFQEVVIALALVMFIHELVHGVFYWWFSGKCPTLGIHGLGIYVGAQPEVYFSRNQYIIIGLSPLLLLTPAGMLLVIIVPVVFVPILILFVVFNAAGAAGDLLTVARLLAFSPDTLMQDNSSGVILYGPEYS